MTTAFVAIGFVICVLGGIALSVGTIAVLWIWGIDRWVNACKLTVLWWEFVRWKRDRGGRS
ncbi:MAG: hypothetical protein KJZ65_06530 [Phycisphaerales bacterium]|nr:hypothetical protein [Phycisphaerales bacterium]